MNLRALAILVLPVMLFMGAAYAFRVYSGQRYLRAICFLVAMISLIAFYVASLGLSTCWRLTGSRTSYLLWEKESAVSIIG